MFLSLRSQVFDAEGESASEPEVTAVLFAMGQLQPRVEQALDGRLSGDVVEVKADVSEAFGKRDPARIVEVDRDEFPDHVAAGERFELESLEGSVIVTQVLDVTEDRVVLDMNHPLADQQVLFRIEILEVRPATTEELEAAELSLQEAGASLTRIEVGARPQARGSDPGPAPVPASSLNRRAAAEK